MLYIYPAAFYLRLRYLSYRKRNIEEEIPILSQYTAWSVMKEAIAWIILVIGILLLVVENYQAIYAVIERTHEPNGQCYLLKCEDTITYTKEEKNNDSFEILHFE